MFNINKKILTLIICGFLLTTGNYAYADETALFTSVAPDALIVLDLSGSMRWTPTGSTMYVASTELCEHDVAFYASSGTGHTKECTINAYGTVPKYSDTTCAGPFYKTSRTNYATNCSRLAIAKRSIFAILDDNNDNTINSSDESSLNIRFGYMRFYDCSSDETDGNYSSGCIRLIREFGTSTTNTKYSRIYCDSSTSCTITSTGTNSINGEDASGGTPLVSALNEAKLYLNANKASDTAGSCRQKFAMLITDGADTYACSGDGSEGQADQYKRRRETVAKAKALADAGYKVFVIGFGGNMPHYLKNTLNWAAYYGGTDNPLDANSPVIDDDHPAAYIPSNVTSCGSSTTSTHDTGDGSHYYADSNDPGESTLTGYAFIATNPDELTTALRQAISIIRESTYSFSEPSIESSRTQDENFIYEASFQPVTNDSFWLGHLKKYNINADGTVGSLVWDAGETLQTMSASSRNIYTYKSGAITAFTTSNITTSDLGVTDDATRISIIGFVRGESTYNKENWKLGDIFRSNPITIGTPSAFFNDTRDTNNAFSTFRSSHERSSANGHRVIVVGANDGQFHVFQTSDGTELWSFVPPNLLPKLKNMAHSAHPTGNLHQYFVDGPITVADVWLGSGDGTSKSSSDWKTLLFFGEGVGAGSGATNAYLWSSSTSCASGFSGTYSSTYSNYCGYYAFDATTAAATPPTFKWRINFNSTEVSYQAPYLGEPWSKMYIGRVIINGNEKWVGFIGGGYNASNCSGGGGCDTRGKGFYVVDLSDGSVLWSYTRYNNISMNYSLSAPAAIVDTDNDGFIDTAYIGDLGNNVWKFKFCKLSDGDSCNTLNWSSQMLYDGSSGVIRPIFTAPTAAKDQSGNLWVYWGTGDKTDPTAANAQEKFYAVKDSDSTSAFGINDLDNITTGTYSDTPNKHGWYINLGGQGEKVLAEPTVFGGVVYFTTYTPTQSNNPCERSGTAKLYGVNYTTGGGVLTEAGARTITLGAGIPSAPLLSFKPGGALPVDLYVTVSGGGTSTSTASTFRVNLNPPTLSNRSNILFWRDRRVQ